MRLARSVGFYASHEPNHHQRPHGQATERHVEDTSAVCAEDGIALPGGWNDHADILLVKHDRKLYVDVAVTRPTTRSRLSVPSESSRVLSTPLYSCRKTADKKHSMYDEIAVLNGYEMIPFVLESYGGIAPEAQSLLRTLSSHATDMKERQWMTHAMRCISVALQAGNAFIAQAGMQQQLTSHTRRDRFQTSQRRYEQVRPARTVVAAPSRSRSRTACGGAVADSRRDVSCSASRRVERMASVIRPACASLSIPSLSIASLLA
jgi:hypothetical protein